MNKLLKKELKGFTIIEVVIVLAIAALIIVIVLLAVGALQRSQRTKSAQDYASRVVSQVEHYTSDQQAGGATPTRAECVPNGDACGTATYFQASDRPSNLSAPQNAALAVNGVKNDAKSGETWYQVGGVCLATNLVGTSDASQIAVAYFSQTANGQVCIHN